MAEKSKGLYISPKEQMEILDKAGVSGAGIEVRREVIEREKQRRIDQAKTRRHVTRTSNKNKLIREQLASESTSWAPKLKPYRRGRD
ncbi:hypothetical protein [Vibrio owensii]|uniref:hypothetical protein n=1 Tax=Vibrio owensii TaxID=696485 RepID=UPI0018F1A38B|nr:hypothetical protein [Vibrio owensii]